MASERIRLLDDPPSVYSIVAFHPVFDPLLPRTAASVRGFACEVFCVRAVAERAIAESVRRGIQVTLLDRAAAPERQILFESAASTPLESALRHESALRYADRRWTVVLTATHAFRSEMQGPAWFALFAGTGIGALLALLLSAARVVRRLRSQVRAAQLGQYTLLQKLGQGGMGVVYRARHAMLRRPTAIKLLADAAHSADRLARFEREVQLTSELSHPNTIAIYDYGRTPDGVFYYAMEFIDGITLEQLVERTGPLPAARVRHVLSQACAALAEAHAAGLVHRDIKPANLMLCRRGGVADWLKVMDFGLAKDVSAAAAGLEATAITQASSSAVMGTPRYLAPEAILQPQQLDGRADLYALGAAAYYLLCGAPVFDADSIFELCNHHLYSKPVPPSQRTDSQVPAALEALVLRCLEKKPDDRFASATAIQEALRTLDGVATWTDADADTWWRERGDALMVAVRAERVDLEVERRSYR